MAFKYIWRGVEVIKSIRQLQIANLKRAAIYLSNAVKKTINRPGTESGIKRSDIDKREILSGHGTRGETVTVTNSEFRRLAVPKQLQRRSTVQERLRARGKIS